MVLGEAVTLNTVQKKIDRLVALEMAEDASGSLKEASTSGAAAAKWKPKNQVARVRGKDRKDDKKEDRGPPRTLSKIRPCRGCGRTSHGPNKTLSRRDCPFYEKKCGSCQFVGHDASICERYKSGAAAGRDETPV